VERSCTSDLKEKSRDMKQVLKIVVVDDSAYVRKVITQMLSRSPFIDVVGTARDANEGLEMVERLKPDVVTLDLIMPGEGGLGFLREQMRRNPIPVVVVSIAEATSELVLDALDAGATDFIQKPSALATDKMFEMADELVEKVKIAATVQMRKPKSGTISAPQPLPAQPGAAKGQIDIVVIGISTGGPQALKRVIPRLPASFPAPVAIVLHMPVGYTELYAQRLSDVSNVKVSEAQHGERVEAGKVLMAPAGRHLKFVREGGAVVTQLDAVPFDTLHRPSVDVLFRSAAEVYGDRVLAVLMTGMGTDGKEGASWVKAKGGTVFTEAEESCVVYGMPRAAVEAGLSDKVVSLENIANSILERV
jgi:two-component system, chemotaxis family, protein-glutamate methylesterase/glutaminase